MAGVFKRKSDKVRGKAGKYTCWYIGEDGKQHQFAGGTDKAKSLEMANHREAEARRIREGIVEPGERIRREASLRSVKDHVEDYKLGLLAKGDTKTRANHIAGAIQRLLNSASVTSVADIAPDRVQEALGRMRVNKELGQGKVKKGASARTCNHALGAVKAFAQWLEHANRIKEVPRGLLAIKPYNEDVDRRKVRRALTEAELARLLEATESGKTLIATRPGRGRKPDSWITGPERAALYRLAMGTGFRANELRVLRPEWFFLDGDDPRIDIPPEFTKNRKGARQPIPRELAAELKGFVAGREPGKPVLSVPEKTAKLLRHDMEAAKIPAVDGSGRVLDFHALRASYVTHLIRRGVNPKVVQRLARHSTITLTMDLYCHVDDADLRSALEGKK